MSETKTVFETCLDLIVTRPQECNRIVNINIVNGASQNLLLSSLKRRAPVATIRALISTGIDLNYCEYFYTALEYSLVTHQFDITSILLDTVGINAAQTGTLHLTPLIVAIHAAAPPTILEKLLRRGADVDTFIHDYQTCALFEAIEKKNEEIIQWLFSKNVNVNVIGFKGITPLLLAIENDLAHVVSQLLKRNANVNQATAQYTPLGLAISKDAKNICKIIMNRPDLDISLIARNNLSHLEIALEKKNHHLILKITDRMTDKKQTQINH